MSKLDVLIRGASPFPAIAIARGQIVGFEDAPAREEIDATGLIALPGVIDAHVHFNEPGRTEWEGLATGSRACAAGGTTTFFDMPLNSTPPVIDAAAFDAKRALAEAKSVVDFGLWGGLVPGHLDQIEELRDRGVIGLKAFMSHSGIEDFPKADPGTLRAGMQRAAALGLLVAVHAEIDHPELRRGSSIREYLDSRPISMELEAIRLALEFAGETRCPLHVVHVSSAAGLALIAAARRAGIDATAETCPHYLTLNEDDVLQIGALAKCAPPIRSEAERRALVAKVRAGEVQTIGSDHSPAPMSMKTSTDFYQVWGGISGVQHLLALLLDLDLPPEAIARLTAENVASRFRLGSPKGRLAIGSDADVVLVDLAGQTTVQAAALEYRHPHTPWLGRTLRGRIVRTLRRGETIFVAGRVTTAGGGRLVRPRP